MNRLKELRKQAGLTQFELADIIGTSRQAINQFELQENGYRKLTIVTEIVKYFHVSTDYLLGVSDE